MKGTGHPEEPTALVEAWSVRIAQAVAPDEIDLAPDLAAAFVAGGAARRELFASAEAGVGGIAPGELFSALPMTFQAVAGTATVLVAVLTAEQAADFLDCIKNCLGIMQLGLTLSRPPKGEGAQGAPPPPTPGTAVPPAPPATATAVPAAEAYAPLRRAVACLGDECRRAGLGDEQADLVTFRLLKVLLEEPRSGAQFVQHLGGAA